jgi:hypothetical protein
MPLNVTMMYSAVWICGDKTDEAGDTTRVRNGTGFFVQIPSEHPTIRDRRSTGYVVTCDHVIRDLTNIEIEAANPYREGELYPPEPVSDWRPLKAHPEADLAFAPYPVPAAQTPIGVPLGSLLQYGLQLALGAHFHYVGLLAPVGIPMARYGTFGALDVPGVPHDGPYNYRCHLADVRSYGGFSGSPCFVEYPLTNLTPLKRDEIPVLLPKRFADVPLGPQTYIYLFCGMFTEHFSDRRMAGLASNLGTGVVLPADLIIEELMTDELRHERAWADERWLAEQPESPVQGASVDEPESDEFEQFQELTRRLVRVPKNELDKKREEGGQ